MVYNYWVEDSQLGKHVEAVRSQAIAGDSSGQFTSQPQQSLNSDQNGDTTTSNYPPYDPDFSQSSLSGLHPFETVQSNGSAAGQHGSVSSAYPHYDLSNYLPAHNLGLSGTNLANSLPITPNQLPHHDAYNQFQFQSQAEPYTEEPVNEHQSGSNALSATYVCRWHDGHLCGRTAYEVGVAEHMSTYHFKSSESAETLLDCKWEGCKLQNCRRDTINRHIREVHLKIPRPKPSKARTITCPRRSRKKAHIN